MLSSQISQYSIEYRNYSELTNQTGQANQPTLIMDSDSLLPFDGTLSKYTNVMKGWQNRFFILNPQHGMLEYFLNQTEAVSSQYKPRGSVVLGGAVIAPSTEDSFTFSVNAPNGEVYKLRATNAKERQEWVSRLRAVVQHFSSQIANQHPPLSGSSVRKPRARSVASNVSNSIKKSKDQVQSMLTGPPGTSSSAKPVAPDELSMANSIPASTSSERNTAQPSKGTINRTTPLEPKRALPKSDVQQLQDARQAIVSADNYHAGLVSMLDSLPFHPNQNMDNENVESASQASDEQYVGLSALDKNVLLIKSTSSAMMQCLSNCYSILHKHSQQKNVSLPPDAKVKWMGKKLDADLQDSHHENGADLSSGDGTLKFEKPNIANPADEVPDSTSEHEEDLGPVDEHKNMIMHLLSQLKLGMDLTKVTLPTFILEKRSLLEMYADFFGYSNLFLSIPKGETAHDRMHRILKFYLASFHSGRNSQAAKKPYNPLVGEVFQCSYYVPKENTSQDTDTESTAPPTAQTHSRLQFIAEQVSHHPPVSAFHISCPESGISCTSHIWTKAKFMNMSVGAVVIGEGTITLKDHDEHYTTNYPSAYARSILTVPWYELGGRCSLVCQENDITSNIIFHTKPMYGGMPHRVTAEVKDKSGYISCKVQGKWNGELEFTYFNESNANQAPTPSHSETIDTAKLECFPKYVRPLDAQDALESRKVWREVTQSLRSGDVTSATEHKTALENQQREIERQRKEAGLPVPVAYFSRTKGKDYDLYSLKSDQVLLPQQST